MVTKKYDKFFRDFNNIVSDELEQYIVLYYPGIRQECNNCYLDTFANINKSISRFKQGGPMPFENGMPCPYCNGDGYKHIDKTERIPGRVYTSNKNFNMFKNMQIPSGSIIFICRADFFAKIQMSTHMIPETELKNLTVEKYELIGQPEDTGFAINPVKYITSVWNKAIPR